MLARGPVLLRACLRRQVERGTGSQAPPASALGLDGLVPRAGLRCVDRAPWRGHSPAPGQHVTGARRRVPAPASPSPARPTAATARWGERGHVSARRGLRQQQRARVSAARTIRFARWATPRPSDAGLASHPPVHAPRAWHLPGTGAADLRGRLPAGGASSEGVACLATGHGCRMGSGARRIATRCRRWLRCQRRFDGGPTPPALGYLPETTGATPTPPGRRQIPAHPPDAIDSRNARTLMLSRPSTGRGHAHPAPQRASRLSRNPVDRRCAGTLMLSRPSTGRRHAHPFPHRAGAATGRTGAGLAGQRCTTLQW